jgi:hypothetical protein
MDIQVLMLEIANYYAGMAYLNTGANMLKQLIT